MPVRRFQSSAVLVVAVLGLTPLAAKGVADSSDSNPPLEIVRVATDATWPPMEFIDEKGVLVGFDIDLFREIGTRAGFDVSFTNVSWEGIFAGLAANQYDVIASSVTILPERRERMLFSDAYLTAAQYLLVRSDNQAESISDLVGSEVGAEIGTTGAEFVRKTPGVTLRAYDDLGLALRDLDSGRLTGVVADTAIVAHYVFQSASFSDRLRIAGPPYATEMYGFAIRNDRGDLKQAIDLALAELVADGTFDRIFRKWLPSLPYAGTAGS